MRFASILAVAAGLFGTSQAHMAMESPAPINYKTNPYASNIDYSYTTPLGTYPCKGQLANLNSKAGTPVATWTAGSQQTIKIAGSAVHNGGSCQFSLSYDNGATFRVIKSIIGKCPLTPSYSVTIPSDAPNAQSVIFAWSWFNRTGNREMYMNCAVVTITGGSGVAPPPTTGGNTGSIGAGGNGASCGAGCTCSCPAGATPANSPSGGGSSSGVGFSSRPLIYIANVPQANGVVTIEGTDVNFPNPGPDVDRN